nr:hypothetical protein [Anaerolineaceae bacterium]
EVLQLYITRQVSPLNFELSAFLDRMLAWIGGLLVSTGNRMVKRYGTNQVPLKEQGGMVR